MKKTLYIGFFAIILSYGFNTVTSDPVDKKELTASCKKKIEPYKYDSQKFTTINFIKKTQLLEIEVPVFVGEKYRLVFNTTNLPQPIKINVYTKDKDAKKREAIFIASSTEKEMTFDVQHVRKLYVEYNVPSDSSASNASGIVVFMIGYI